MIQTVSDPLTQQTAVNLHGVLSSAQVGLAAAFGGGIITSLLIQDPKQAPIALFSHNVVGVTWTVCWWLVNYFPFNLVGRIVLFFPVRILLKVRMICMHILPLPLLLASPPFCACFSTLGLYSGPGSMPPFSRCCPTSPFIFCALA